MQEKKWKKKNFPSRDPSISQPSKYDQYLWLQFFLLPSWRSNPEFHPVKANTFTTETHTQVLTNCRHSSGQMALVPYGTHSRLQPTPAAERAENTLLSPTPHAFPAAQPHVHSLGILSVVRLQFKNATPSLSAIH